MVTVYFTLLFDDILRMRFFNNMLIIANISLEFKFKMNLRHMLVGFFFQNSVPILGCILIIVSKEWRLQKSKIQHSVTWLFYFVAFVKLRWVIFLRPKHLYCTSILQSIFNVSFCALLSFGIRVAAYTTYLRDFASLAEFDFPHFVTFF